MVEEHSTSADMTYVVSLSGGVGSAVAAERARASLWQAGTALVELRPPRRRRSLSLHAGHSETMVAGLRSTTLLHRNQRNPLVVAEQKAILPTERRAPCSHEREDRLMETIHC